MSKHRGTNYRAIPRKRTQTTMALTVSGAGKRRVVDRSEKVPTVRKHQPYGKM